MPMLHDVFGAMRARSLHVHRLLVIHVSGCGLQPRQQAELCIALHGTAWHGMGCTGCGRWKSTFVTNKSRRVCHTSYQTCHVPCHAPEHTDCLLVKPCSATKHRVHTKCMLCILLMLQGGISAMPSAGTHSRQHLRPAHQQHRATSAPCCAWDVDPAGQRVCYRQSCSDTLMGRTGLRQSRATHCCKSELCCA